MKKFIEEKNHIILVILMVIGLLFSIFRICTLNYAKKYEEEKNILYMHKEQIAKNFDNLYEIEDAYITIQKDNYVVTICEEDHNLELKYDKNYELISERIITVHHIAEYIFIYTTFYTLIVPGITYLIVMAVFWASFTIIEFIQKRE